MRRLIIGFLIVALFLPCGFVYGDGVEIPVGEHVGISVPAIICLSLGIWGLSEKPKSRYVKWSCGYLLAVGTVNLITIRF